MSLINQALRKAQNQRTPNRPATAADHANDANQGYKTASTGKPGLLIGLVAGIALLIGLVAGLTIVVLRKEPAPVAQQATIPAAARTTQVGPVATAAPSHPALQPLAPAPQAPTQAVEQNSPSVLDELRIARQAAEAKAATDAAAAALATKQAVEAEAVALAAKQAAAAKAAAKPSQDIIHWLAQAKISGVRISGSASKVILNNKAYSIGDTVHVALGLKVLIIQEKRILFTDAKGKKYLKQLL
ncbi:MAG: hypothetical protein ACI8Z5_000295 [Lentimonas sp.]|jgi:hypothetical protein